MKRRSSSHSDDPLLVLGIMSGTSVDGVDYALCAISESRIVLRKMWHYSFPGNLARRIHAAASDQCSAHELAQLHHDLGRFYARRAKALRDEVDLASKPALVGLHGQTVFHNPDPAQAATLQIGEPAYLVEALRLPVVSNFRPGDIAAGGQGAPLATAFHQKVFSEKGRHVCVNNLGGISNVTSLDWTSGSAPKILAFDTGPGCVLLDLLMRELHASGQASYPFDQNGKLASKGRICEPLLKAWLRHPYFKLSPPKSTGRELFGEPFYQKAKRDMGALRLSHEDKIATLTEFTAISIVLNYTRHLPAKVDKMVLCGGGSRNQTLLRSLQKLFPFHVTTSESEGWPAEAIESAAFALLAYQRWKGSAGNIPATTGASRACVLGSVNVV